MCRHCERLVEDADFKATMHAFMARTAANFERSLREQGIPVSMPITANDISIVVKLEKHYTYAQVANRIVEEMNR